MRRVFVALDRLAEALAFAGVALISVAIGALIIDIVGRKTTGFTILGISDIMQLLVMACICLGMPFVFVREGHVGVEFVTDRLPPRALTALKLAVAVLSSVFVVALLRYGFVQAGQQIAKGDVSNTLAIPIVWYWAPLLIALGVSALACVVHVLRHLVVLVAGAERIGAPREPAA